MINKKSRQCEHPGCQIITELYPRDIQRGKGLFCSHQHANEHRHDTTYIRKCTECDLQFKTTQFNKAQCSIECEEVALQKSTKLNVQNRNA